MVAVGTETRDPAAVELFCQAVARGASYGEAYGAAGLKGDPKAFSKYGRRLAEIPKHAKHIAELTEEVRVAAVGAMKDWLSPEWVLSKTKEAWDLCTSAKDQIAFLKLVGPQVGLFNPERKTRHGQIDELEGKSGKELMERIRALTEKLPASAQRELGIVETAGTDTRSVGGEAEAAEESAESAGEPLPTVH